MAEKRILGIDPSIRHTGWGVIAVDGDKVLHIGNGCITPYANNTMDLRVAAIYLQIQKIIKKYDVDAVAVEDMFFNKYRTTTITLAYARAACLLAVGRHNVEVHRRVYKNRREDRAGYDKRVTLDSYAPRLVKKCVTGAGNANKDYVKKMVKTLLPKAKIENEHSADALAVALTHHHMES